MRAHIYPQVMPPLQCLELKRVCWPRADCCDKTYCRKWLDTHLKDQWYMGKPVVIEEFGKAIGTSPAWLLNFHNNIIPSPMTDGLSNCKAAKCWLARNHHIPTPCK